MSSNNNNTTPCRSPGRLKWGAGTAKSASEFAFLECSHNSSVFFALIGRQVILDGEVALGLGQLFIKCTDVADIIHRLALLYTHDVFGMQVQAKTACINQPEFLDLPENVEFPRQEKAKKSGERNACRGNKARYVGPDKWRRKNPEIQPDLSAV